MSVLSRLAVVGTLALFALPAAAQTISLNFTFGSDSGFNNTEEIFISQNSVTNTVSLTSGVTSSAVGIGSLSGTTAGEGNFTLPLTRETTFSVNGGTAFNGADLTYNATLNAFTAGPVGVTTLSNTSSSTVFTLAGFGTLTVAVQAANSGPLGAFGSFPSPSYTPTATFLFTAAPVQNNVAPEPATLALLLPFAGGILAARKRRN